MFMYRAIVFFRFFKMAMATILDLEVKMVPNLKNKQYIEFVMSKIVELDISLIFKAW